MKERVLFVDDDPNILEGYQRKLQQALPVSTAEGPQLGLKEIEEKGPFAVVIADMNMPLMNGVEFLKKVQEMAPDTVRMMLTGNADIKVAMQAVNDGNVFRFLTKPCPSKLMGESLIAGIAQYRLVTAEKALLEGTLNGAVELLAEILSWVNPYAFGRTVQIRNFVTVLASKLEVKDPWEITLAGTLSQIGCMAIPQDVFVKLSVGDPLDEDEQKALASVPAVGQELLERIPRLDNVARIVLYQNKRYDGVGLPDDGVAGKDIPLGARILKVANDYIDLKSSGESKAESLKRMQERDGWYDPRVLKAVGRMDKPEAVEAAAWRTVQVSLRDLRVGLKLVSDIMTVDGRKLVGTGTVISSALLIRIRKFAEAKGVIEPIEALIHS